MLKANSCTAKNYKPEVIYKHEQCCSFTTGLNNVVLPKILPILLIVVKHVTPDNVLGPVVSKAFSLNGG